MAGKTTDDGSTGGTAKGAKAGPEKTSGPFIRPMSDPVSGAATTTSAEGTG